MISQDPTSKYPTPLQPTASRLPLQETSTGNLNALAHSLSGIVREYPGPSILIGAGLAWMFVSRESRKGQPLPERLRDRAIARKDSLQAAAGDAREHLLESAGEARDSLREAAHNAKEQTMDRLGEAKLSAEERLERARNSLHDTAENARTSLHGGAEKTREVYQSLLQENPLLLGAVAAALGLSIGMLLPATEPEDRVLGPTRDNLLDQARSIVDNARQAAVESLRFGAENVKAHLEEAAHDAKATLTESLEVAKEVVKDEFEQAKESASESTASGIEFDSDRPLSHTDEVRPDPIV